jgi:hypothetical protein
MKFTKARLFVLAKTILSYNKMYRGTIKREQTNLGPTGPHNRRTAAVCKISRCCNRAPSDALSGFGFFRSQLRYRHSWWAKSNRDNHTANAGCAQVCRALAKPVPKRPLPVSQHITVLLLKSEGACCIFGMRYGLHRPDRFSSRSVVWRSAAQAWQQKRIEPVRTGSRCGSSSCGATFRLASPFVRNGSRWKGRSPKRPLRCFRRY